MDNHTAGQRRILVTGVGGAPGLDLARRLQQQGCEVIAVDANPHAPGLLLPHSIARTIPPAHNPGYGTALLELCKELRPDGLVSTVEQELAHLVALRSALEEIGVRTWLPSALSVAACVDKAVFVHVLGRNHIPVPRTWLPHELADVPDGTDLVVKPRRAHGAQGVTYCSTRRQASVLCELVEDPIVQERIAGVEFTADCLVDRTGRASVILRHRLLVKGGLAVVSRTFHDDRVADLVKATLAAVGAAGACCAQGFISKHGRHPVVIGEVNARVAGGFLLAEEAGADLVGQLLRGLFDQPIDHDRLTYKPGVYLAKYTETLATGRRTPDTLNHTPPRKGARP